MAAPHGAMTAFNTMIDGYLAYRALPDTAAQAASLRERVSFRAAQVGRHCGISRHAREVHQDGNHSHGDVVLRS